MGKLYLLTQKQLDTLVAARVETALAESNDGLERELLMKQANLAALQEQINPHFLYNALECIRGQALMENAETVASAAHALSQYFRYCISNKRGEVTLRDELNYVKDYITIQQFRFQDRFILEQWVEDDAALDVIVPKLMLQPLVENAIIHGLADKTEGGRIEIRVISSRKHITIRVSDNGIGISAEKLRELNDRIDCPLNRENAQNEQGNGIALGNVNDRLKMRFGDAYGMSIFSSGVGCGTTVDIYIPASYSTKP